MTADSILIIDDGCFACGKSNAFGLKLDIHPSEEPERPGLRARKKSVCDFVLAREFQGYGGIIHGGILSTILDELMIYAMYYEHIPTVTAKMEVTFKQKVADGESLRCEGWMSRDRGKFVESEGAIYNAKGQVVAKAKGLFVRVEKVIRT